MLARGLVGRIVRVAGWGLIILGMVAVSVIVTRGAFRAHSDAQFNRWTGWATILALSIAGVGVALVAWDRIVKIIWPDKESGQEPLTAEDKLSATRNAECELPGRPLTEETDPFALEVHRPVEPDAGTSQDLPLLPPYVRRPHDEELARVTRIATEGRSGIAVLVGGSSTGKTRACWETLKTISDTSTPNAPWRLWHPIAPSHREAVLKGLPNVAPCTVIWLNDAQLYLDTPDGEEVAADLRELLRDGKRAPILVLATLWPEHWSTLTSPSRLQCPRPSRPGPRAADGPRHQRPIGVHRHATERPCQGRRPSPPPGGVIRLRREGHAISGQRTGTPVPLRERPARAEGPYPRSDGRSPTGRGGFDPAVVLGSCRSWVRHGLGTELPRRRLAARVPEVRRATLQGRPRAVDPHPPASSLLLRGRPTTSPTTSTSTPTTPAAR